MGRTHEPRTRLSRRLAAALIVLASAPALADESPHLVVAELFGKAGTYGVGYEYTSILPWLGVGGVASYADVRDQQIVTVTAYAHATAWRRGGNALFGELGASFVHSRIPSPVDDWDGMADSGVGAIATFGYERVVQRFVLRGYGAAVVGKNGVGPWVGIAIGYRP